MKTLKILSFGLLTVLWWLISSTILAAITATSPNWSPTRSLITQNPLIGRSSKSIGSNVGYRWFNKNVFRTKPLIFTEGVSAPREIQKLFFKDAQLWAKRLLDTIRLGLKQQAIEMPAYSWFIGWLLREAGDSYPGPTAVDIAKIEVSKGTLTGLADLAITPVAGNKFDFAWTDNSGSGNALATDGVYVAWWNPVQLIGGSELTGTVKRDDALINDFDVNSDTDDDVYFWVFCASANEAITSNSDIATKVKSITS
jgi:hypothetical protein